jgi:hypothetical protein
MNSSIAILEGLDPNVEYPVWSPYDSYEAAATLAQLLADAKSKS